MGGPGRAAALCLGLFALTGASSAFAAEPDYSAQNDWLSRGTLTGDWGGVRRQLDEAGIKLEAHHTSESGYNPSGGFKQAARYTQQFDINADLDLERLAGLRGGEVFITFAHRMGRSLSADAIGNIFAVQEVFGGGRVVRLVALHYQQKLLNDQLLFDVGWEPVGNYFASSPAVYCAYFQNLATCGTLFFNGSWGNYPVGQWGARVQYEPRPGFSVSTGVYQVDPNHGKASRGLDLNFRGTGILTPFEVRWASERGLFGLPSEYKVGGYFDSSRAPDVFTDVNGLPAGLTGAPFVQHNGRWGAYALATQMVFREAPQGKRGLSLFGMAYTADPETATFSRFLVGGAIYQGTFPGRDDDYVGVAFGELRFNDRRIRFQRDQNSVTPGAVDVQTRESVVEVDYNVAVTPWLQVRPNIQYVFRPGGAGTIPDPVVLGLFTRITF
jgi:porin